MKKLILTIGSLTLTLISPAFASTNAAYVNVNGLVCDFCARALEKVFGQQEAVESIDVNLDTKVITVSFKDGQNLEDEMIAKLITDSGYAVEAINREEGVDE